MTSAPNHDAIEAKLDELESKLMHLESAALGRLLDACTPAEPELLPFLFSLYYRSLIPDLALRERVRVQDIKLRRSLREQRYRLIAEEDERNKLLAQRLAKASYDNSNSAGTQNPETFLVFHLIC
jgi:hypothetical protein